MGKLFDPWFNICAIDFPALAIYFLQPSSALFFLVPFRIVCSRCSLWICVHTSVSQCGHTSTLEASSWVSGSRVDMALQ